MARCEGNRHPEILELASSGGWPDRCDPELRLHLESCVDCADLASVVAAIAVDREMTLPRIAVPPAGAMWWKAQRRVQLESAVAAERTVTALQLVTLATVIVIAIGLLRSFIAWNTLDRWFGAAFRTVGEAIVLPHVSISILIAVLACVALAPIAIAIAVRE